MKNERGGRTAGWGFRRALIAVRCGQAGMDKCAPSAIKSGAVRGWVVRQAIWKGACLGGEGVVEAGKSVAGVVQW